MKVVKIKCADTRIGETCVRNYAEILEAEEITLEFLQDGVGGFIEVLRMPTEFKPYVMIVNEEGAIRNLPLNVFASALMGLTIKGDVLIARKQGNDIVGIDKLGEKVFGGKND